MELVDIEGNLDKHERLMVDCDNNYINKNLF